jgi:hypothetical protein
VPGFFCHGLAAARIVGTVVLEAWNIEAAPHASQREPLTSRATVSPSLSEPLFASIEKFRHPL